MPCKDCYNGCVETVSDSCVKYTGPDLEFLNVTSGDSFLSVISTFTTYIEEISSGQFPVEFNQEIICEWMTGFFPVSSNSTVEGIGLPDIIEGLIQAICSLKENIVELETDPTYDISCLTGVTSTSSTEDILQQLITQFCALLAAFTDFSTNPPSYTVANVGGGSDIYKDSTVVGDNTQFNFKTIVSLDGSVLVEDTVGFNTLNLTVDGSATILEAGDNINITGIGTVGNPYIIEGVNDGSSTELVDSTTVNVSGTGTLLDPYSLSVLNPQLIITTDLILTNAHNNSTIFINNGVNNIFITVAPGLIDNFNASFIQQGTGDVAFTNGVGVTINTPVGLLIKSQNYWAHLEKVQATEVFQLLGSLKI